MKKPPVNADDLPLSDRIIAGMRPASEIVPDIVAAYEQGTLQETPARRVRGSQKQPVKVQTTIRLDRDVVGYFKKDGRGWQSRLNKVLREHVLGRKEIS